MITAASRKKIFLVSGGALACGLGVLGVILFYRHHPAGAPVASSPGSTLLVPDSLIAPLQRNVDASLSLFPSSKPAPGLPAAALKKGCALSLDFYGAGGHYTLVAKNLGDTSCRSASISIYYADNESFLSASPAATSNGYYWRIGELAPDKEFKISLATQKIGGGAGAMTADEGCLSADNGADACSNVTSGPSRSITPNPIAAISGIIAPKTGQEFGVWVWTPLTQMTPERMGKIVNSAAANRFNAIYLTMDDYLDTSPQSLPAYEQSAATFLSLAQAKGIEVDAEAGWRDWGEPQNTGKAYAILAFIAAFNRSHAAKFRGVQYDIEPYLLPAYTNDEIGVLTRYVQLVSGLAAADKQYGLPLTMVVPHFYDSAVQWTPQVTVDGITDFPYEHILHFLSGIAGSRIIVMAYRNFATGTDGSIDLAAQEVHDADATGVKIIVAQETGPVTPGYVTFYGFSKNSLSMQIADITQAFSADKSFAGIGIDYLDTFLNLP